MSILSTHEEILEEAGHLPPKAAEVTPWETLCIDLVGPYSIDVEIEVKPKKGRRKKKEVQTLTLHCMTMIDPATGWFEIKELPYKQADIIANLLQEVWMSRYPWPDQIVLDRGSEFMAEVKRMLYHDYGITRKPITARNPQANAMVERAHQTIGNMIRSQLFKDTLDLDDPFQGLLNSVGLAMRAMVHTTT